MRSRRWRTADGSLHAVEQKADRDAASAPNQNNDECDLCSCGKACKNNSGVATKLVVDMTAFLAELATNAGPHARPSALQPSCRSIAADFPRPQKRCVSALLLTTDSIVPAVIGARIALHAVAMPNDEFWAGGSMSWSPYGMRCVFNDTDKAASTV